ncbi:MULTISPECIES: UDP-glucose/GDP-mannose dehydrogenase family protein [unclassified Frigoribacterium]|uniref:UDP-glucose dehydrogenase family protein n=1 Tax=unclassified Frigoribacterium TaxID=2627005 RepID=UPI0006F30947|nr:MULTISPECIES: UDP-glucose/GDP-mannose dehydrogenase family protein [unclassified Frigoribacterium]KQO82449.1 UDP-glucose 6-dehydrogenase [Frigoribacterium sp. Leaf263]KQR64867.1 UDP-glucose 6-dehydrogenase [Frigoribacterium sp. Leaf172]
MRISVIGCGYLGAVHAACMAELGHEVVGIDVDEHKVSELAAGRAPFFEPGLPEVLGRALESGRLRFSTDLADAAGAEVHFVAVGTPQTKGSHAADLTYVNAAVEGLLPHLSDGDLVVGKSTVPVGTATRLADVVRASSGADLAWNPEFLREGFAVKDTLTPDRFVYGVAPGEAGERATAQLDEVYSTALAAETPRLVTDYATAELVKVSANAFLATKISFINAMAEVAEATGADVTQLADAIGYDARIGRRFLNAGIGFGGGCLPKDIRAFQARADELGLDSLAFLADVDAINLRRRDRVVALAEQLVGDVSGARVAVLGLAFKPNSDDIRDSPALDVARRLRAAGAVVTAYDPEANHTASRIAPELDYVDDVESALRDADVALVLTEWTEFRELDPAVVSGLMAHARVVDGRNTLDVAAWRGAGFDYRGLGRP